MGLMDTDINVIIENLNELLTNSINLTDKYYDIFINPTPMYVDLEQFNEENQLIVVTVPNMAMYKQNLGVNDGVLTIKRNNATLGQFTANQATSTEVNIEIPTKTSELANDSGYIQRNYLLKNITDCIIKIENPISITVNDDGIPVLHQGSVAYFPNGYGVNTKAAAPVDFVMSNDFSGVLYNPDAFTIVGNPTITDEGVASGFSSENRVEGSLDSQITPAESIIFTIEGVAKDLDTAPGSAQVLGSLRGTVNPVTIDVYSNQIAISGSELSITNLNIQDDDMVKAQFVATSTNLTLNVWVNGQLHTNYIAGDTLNDIGDITGFWITHSSDTYCWQGSIDIKQFSITVDGEKVVAGGEETPIDGEYLLCAYSRNGGSSIHGFRADLVVNCNSGDSVPEVADYQGMFYHLKAAEDPSQRASRIYLFPYDHDPSNFQPDTLISFPIALVTAKNNRVEEYKSINVFDAIGFIGTCMYSLPNITYLIPNGRNEDETLINKEATSPNVSISDFSLPEEIASTLNLFLQDVNGVTNLQGITPLSLLNKVYYYDEIPNMYLRRSDNTQLFWCKAGTCTVDTETRKVISVDVNKPFRAADYAEMANLNNLLDYKANTSLDNLTEEAELKISQRIPNCVSEGKAKHNGELDIIIGTETTVTTNTQTNKRIATYNKTFAVGTNTFTTPSNLVQGTGNVTVNIVGGGGNGVADYSITYNGPMSAGGGSGAAFKGTVTLQPSTTYTIVVGSAGKASSIKKGSTNIITAGAGGSAKSNSVVITVAGKGGTVTRGSAVASGTNYNGKGSVPYANAYGCPGGTYATSSLPYGKGGDGSTTASKRKGHNGYCKITYTTDVTETTETTTTSLGSQTVDWDVDSNNPLTVILPNKQEYKTTSLTSDNLSELPNGTYNKWVGPNNAEELLRSTHTISYNAPVTDEGQEIIGGEANQVWTKIGTPYAQYIYRGGKWIPFNKVLVGTIKVKDGVVSDDIDAIQNVSLYDNNFNLTQTFGNTDKIAGWSAPSTHYDNISLLPSGDPNGYIAPANGWFSFRKVTGTANAYISIESGGRVAHEVAPTTNYSLGVTLPIAKGQKAIVTYTASGATTHFRFYYDIGSLPEGHQNPS